MGFIEWITLLVGAGLIVSGVRAIRRRQAHTPEEWQGEGAVSLGWLWIGMGVLFLMGVLFDIAWIKGLFRLFLEAAN